MPAGRENQFQRGDRNTALLQARERPLRHRFNDVGVYFLDEPEAALSFHSCLGLTSAARHQAPRRESDHHRDALAAFGVVAGGDVAADRRRRNFKS